MTIKKIFLVSSFVVAIIVMVLVTVQLSETMHGPISSPKNGYQ